MNLTGNAFTYFDRMPGADTPAAIYALNPPRTYIVPDKRGGIKGYLYVPENTAMSDGVPLVASDVSHVKFPNPSDPLDGYGYGLSPISPLARSADVDNSITAFLKVFFDKGTNASGILKSSVPLRDEDVARIRERWKEIYGGYENMAEEIGVLDQTI